MNGRIKKILADYAALKCPTESRLTGKTMKQFNFVDSSKGQTKTVKHVTVFYEGRRQFFQELKKLYNRKRIDLDFILKELIEDGSYSAKSRRKKSRTKPDGQEDAGTNAVQSTGVVT